MNKTQVTASTNTAYAETTSTLSERLPALASWISDFARPVPVAAFINKHSINQQPAMFEKMPFEIIHLILESLDFASLASISAVNYNCYCLLKSYAPYVDMINHAPGVLRALGATRCISLFTAPRAYLQLRSDRCVLCNDFGPFLYLLTCERCCYRCLNNCVRFTTIRAATVRSRFSLRVKDVRTLPSLLSLPKRSYNSENRQCIARRCRLVNLGEVIKLEEFMRTGSEPVKDDQAWSPHEGSINYGDVGRFCFAAIAAIPHLDTKTRRLQHGLFCKGCTKRPLFRRSENAYRQEIHRAFSEDEFDEHARNCQGVLKLQKKPRNATKPLV